MEGLISKRIQSFSQTGICIVRIIAGILLMVHGTQMFIPEDMSGYGQWLSDLHFVFPLYFAYAGKVVELLGGACLALGLFTRIVSVLIVITFLAIAIFMGNGKIFTDAQHPFLFALLAAIFFFVGPGILSIDYYVKKNKQ